MLSLCLKGLKWLCPCCWLVQTQKQTQDEEDSDIQMMAYPFIKRVSSRQRLQPPLLNKQKYHTPTEQTRENLDIPKRFSHIDRPSEKQINSLLNSKIKDGDEFLSFKRSQSLIKKNFKVLRLSGAANHESSVSLYDSMTKISFENKQQFQQIIQNFNNYVQTKQSKQLKLKGTDVLELHRLKKRLLIEAQNQIQEFQYFTSELDMIYQNKDINMIVELKKQQTMFQTKTYCILCKILCPAISIVSLLKILNSIQFQQIFNSFSKVKSVCQKPDVIVQTKKSNINLTTFYTLNILKFLSLLSQQQTNKVYAMQIDTNISLQTFSNHTQDFYKKILRLVRNEDNKIELEIYVEESFGLNVYVKPDEYYRSIYEGLAKYLIRKLKAL